MNRAGPRERSGALKPRPGLWAARRNGPRSLACMGRCTGERPRPRNVQRDSGRQTSLIAGKQRGAKTGSLSTLDVIEHIVSHIKDFFGANSSVIQPLRSDVKNEITRFSLAKNKRKYLIRRAKENVDGKKQCSFYFYFCITQKEYRRFQKPTIRKSKRNSCGQISLRPFSLLATMNKNKNLNSNNY